MDKKWLDLIENVDYAFQPIVNIHSGKIYALEALIRDFKSEYFPTIDSVFDAACSENMLYKIDMLLREIAIKKFVKCSFSNEMKLFYNIDNRITAMPDYESGKTIDIMNKYGLDKSNICFELSEKHQVGAYAGIDHLVLKTYKQQGYKIAIDDFGVGFSGLQMLYRSEPDFIKIDRFFVSDIDSNNKKKLFVNSIIEMAQAMGISVIAEGVETREEFNECKKLGCNMVQGYFVSRPTQNLDEISKVYKSISLSYESDKRAGKKIQNIDSYLEKLPYLKENANLDEVFGYLRLNLSLSMIPIIGEDYSPIGIIKEVDLKKYTYSQFGYSILKNQTSGEIKKFIIPCGIADINDSLDKILKIYSYNSKNGGIFITKDKKYVGYLSASTILNIISERSVLDAKEQNPLTGLNGNKVIKEYITDRLSSGQKSVMVYFDFDNFKPFNDFYGFRQGDRVIMMFADALKKNSMLKDSLVGHIGGDDFFLGWRADELDTNIYEMVEKITLKFVDSVDSFYEKKERDQKYIEVRDRNGVMKKFNLLSVSAAVLLVTNGKNIEEEIVAQELSKLKKSAKMMKSHVTWGTLLG